MTKRFILHLSANHLILLAVVMGALVLSPMRLSAQSFYGSIVGTLTDTSGAAVPGATVTMTNLATNEKRTEQSDATGNYRFVNVIPANYKVEAAKTNYKRSINQPVSVLVGSSTRVDAALAVGEITETVEISTQAPLLQTESGTLGSQIEGKQVAEMPLNGRNTMNLIALVPGVVPQSSAMGSTTTNHGTHTNNDGWGNYQIGGGLGNYGAMFIDGAPLNYLGGNFLAFVPTQDATQEFKVSTNSTSAEFGRFEGGVVEMTTKSGGNAWHGALYEYLRNRVFNANDWFSNHYGTARAKWNQNQYGATASGPIKKDKVFFMFSWEAYASRSAALYQTTVPTTDLQNGIFVGKRLTDSTGRCNILYNAGTNTSTIPSACLDPVAAVVRTMQPPPNYTASSSSNYLSNPVTGNDNKQYNARVDYNINSNQRAFARYTYFQATDLGQNNFNNYGGFETGNAYGTNSAHQAVLGDTFTFNPTTILDVRLSYTRTYSADTPRSLGQDLSIFGTDYNALSSQVTWKVLPQINFTGSRGLSGAGGNSRLNFNWSNTYDANVSLFKILGKHTLKFGGNVRLMDRLSSGSYGGTSGSYTFQNSAYTNDEWANFLLGYHTSSTLYTAKIAAAYNYYQGYYMTDTWQLLRKLTLNIGLRWELPGGLAERQNRSTVLLPDAIDANTGAYGTLALLNSSMYSSRTSQPTKHDLLSPRVSFAYRMSANTVLAAGYALAYAAPDLQPNMHPVNSPIMSLPNQWINPAGSPTRLLKNPYPTGVQQPTAGKNFDTFMATQYMAVVSGPVPTSVFPYSQQWNLSLSRQMKGDFMVSASYVGMVASHLPQQVAQGLNQLSSKYFSLESSLTTTAYCAATGTIISVGQCKRPHPYYQNLSDTAAFTGSTNYHALQARVQKRFANGGTVAGAYTWSKSIGNVDLADQSIEGQNGVGVPQDYNNMKGERSLLSQDLTQRLVVNYVLNLPFGKGQKYMSGASGIVNGLVGGWSVNGITTFQDGFPLKIVSNANALVNYFGAGTLRPNVVPGVSKKSSGSATDRITHWFNNSTTTPVFTAPGAYQFGNESRVDSTLRAHGTNNWDIAVQKSTSIAEKASVVLRFEFFNAFNRVQLTAPSTTLGGKNFGVVTSEVSPRKGQVSMQVKF